MSSELEKNIEDLQITHQLNKDLLVMLMEKPPLSSNSVMQALLAENLRLESNLNTLYTEMEQMNAQVLLTEQIATDYKLKEEQEIVDFREKIKELQYLSDRKTEFFLVIDNKRSQLQAHLDLCVKSKNTFIVLPTPELLEVNQKVQGMKDIMQNSARQFLSVARYKKVYQEVCQGLIQDCNKLQVLLQNPINRRAHTPNKFQHQRAFSQFPIQTLDFLPFPQQESTYIDIESKLDIQNLQSDFLKFQQQSVNLQASIKQTMEELIEVVQENQQIRDQNEKLAEIYQSIVRELEDYRESISLDYQFPRNSVSKILN